MDSEPCPRCASTTFDALDGGLYCSSCGLYQHALAPESDDEDYARRGRTVRLKTRKDRDRGKGKVRRVYRGEKAWRLFLVAWGWVLWRGCWRVVNLKLKEEGEGRGFGGEFGQEVWGVVRGLWALRLGTLEGRFRDDDVADGGGEEGESKRGEGMESETTDTDTEAEAEVKGEEQKTKMKTARKASDNPTLIDVAAMIYLGFLMLRYPLTLETFFRWIQNDTLPLIRAIRHVPKDIRDRLPAEYHLALDTLSPPKPQDLQLAVSRMATMYTTTFGVTIPPLNFHLILLSHIENLALPLQIYRMVKYLNTILKFSFAYPKTYARLTALSHPETQLTALVVIATKLLFPFPNPKSTSTQTPMYAYALNDPSAMALDWHIWLTAKNTYDAALLSPYTTTLTPGTAMNMKDTDILEMSESQLDAYMDFYQGMWVNPERREEGIGKRILDMFPLKPLQGQDESGNENVKEMAARERDEESRRKRLRKERIKSVQAGLRVRKTVSKGEEDKMVERGELEGRVMRVGDGYQIFRKIEELDRGDDERRTGEEGGVARVFHEEAAELACTTVEALVRAVRSAEEGIERWRRERRRAEMFGNREGVEAEREETRDLEEGKVMDLDVDVGEVGL